MANGHAVNRGGFDSKVKGADIIYDLDDTHLAGDDQIKATKGESVAVIDGGDGDDVIIGNDGINLLIGGDGEDDISGGGGFDLLIGGDVDGGPPPTDDHDGDGTSETDPASFAAAVVSGGTFTQDAYSDDFNAGATFEENGTDVIFGYDADDGGANDDTGGTEDDGIYDVVDFSDTIDFVDPSADGQPITTAEKEAQLDADLSYDDTTGALSYQGDTFFVVLDETGSAAGTVYVEVDGDQFVYDTTENDWDLVA